MFKLDGLGFDRAVSDVAVEQSGSNAVIALLKSLHTRAATSSGFSSCIVVIVFCCG